jgi:hypothetical protein
MDSLSPSELFPDNASMDDKPEAPISQPLQEPMPEPTKDHEDLTSAEEEEEALMRRDLQSHRRGALRALAVAEGSTIREAKHAASAFFGGSLASEEEPKAALISLILAKRRQKTEELREDIRRALVNAVGGRMEAFRMIDLSGTGKICMQELTDGFERIGVDWRQITGFRHAGSF